VSPGQERDHQPLDGFVLADHPQVNGVGNILEELSSSGAGRCGHEVRCSAEAEGAGSPWDGR
jgi:hypothetical protein